MTMKNETEAEMLIKSIIAQLDIYGMPHDAPENYRNKRSVGCKNLIDFKFEAEKYLAKSGILKNS